MTTIPTGRGLRSGCSCRQRVLVEVKEANAWRPICIRPITGREPLPARLRKQVRFGASRIDTGDRGKRPHGGEACTPRRYENTTWPGIGLMAAGSRSAFASPFHAFVIVGLVRTIFLSSIPHSSNNGASGGAFSRIAADYRGARCTARRAARRVRRSACPGRRLFSVRSALIRFRLRHCAVRCCRSTQDQGSCSEPGTDAHHGFVLI